MSEDIQRRKPKEKTGKIDSEDKDALEESGESVYYDESNNNYRTQFRRRKLNKVPKGKTASTKSRKLKIVNG